MRLARLIRGAALRQLVAGGVALALMAAGVALALRALSLDGDSYRRFERSAEFSRLTLEVQQLASELRAWEVRLLLEVLNHPTGEEPDEHLDFNDLRSITEAIELRLARLAELAPDRPEVERLGRTLREIDRNGRLRLEAIGLRREAARAGGQQMAALSAPLFDSLHRELAELGAALARQNRVGIDRAQRLNEFAQSVLAAFTMLALVLAASAAWMTLRARRQNERLLAQLEQLVEQDALTGITNRRGLDHHLPRELARAERERTTLTLVMIDLDHFKLFNDLRGHAAGDALLIDMAAAWQGELRGGDIFARYGGEEFTLVLPDAPAPDAAALIERLRALMPERQTFSAGIAAWDGAESADSLLARADAALLRAKRTGRDRSVMADARGNLRPASGLPTAG